MQSPPPTAPRPGRPGPTGWRLSVPGGSVGTVDCAGTAGPSLAVERQAAVVDTRAWAGLVGLCLWPPHNATHHAVLVRAGLAGTAGDPTRVVTVAGGD